MASLPHIRAGHEREEFPPPGFDASGSEAEPTREEARRQDLRARVFTGAALLEQTPIRAEPLLGPFLRRGARTILGGHGGEGKTTMALAMVKAFVGGHDFLGSTGVGGTALIIDLEQGISLAQRRVVETFYPGKFQEGVPVLDLIPDLGEDIERIAYADWGEGVDLTVKSIDTAIIDEIIGDLKPDLVMVDPVYKLILGNPNEAELIMNITRAIDAMRVRHGFSSLIPMHPRKPPGQGGHLSMHDLYGAAIWSWWAEIILMLRRTPEAGAVLGFEKDRVEGWRKGDEWKLFFSLAEGFKTAPSQAEGKLSTEKKILKTLGELSPLWATRKELSKMLDVSEDTVIQATQKLVRASESGKLKYLYVDKGDRNTLSYRVMYDAPEKAIQDVLVEFDAVEETSGYGGDPTPW